VNEYKNWIWDFPDILMLGTLVAMILCGIFVHPLFLLLALLPAWGFFIAYPKLNKQLQFIDDELKRLRSEFIEKGEENE